MDSGLLGDDENRNNNENSDEPSGSQSFLFSLSLRSFLQLAGDFYLGYHIGMNRESAYKGIILKKTLYRETDEIITLYTREAGKIRLLARGIKKPTSKLQYALQTMYEVEIAVAGRTESLQTVVQAKLVQAFPHIRSEEGLIAIFFLMAELVTKGTPDGEANPRLFELLESSLEYLNTLPAGEEKKPVIVCKFILEFLTIFGIGVSIPEDSINGVIYFSNAGGGFTMNQTVDAVKVSAQILTDTRLLVATSIKDIAEISLDGQALKGLLTGFASYQIERRLNSERFL